MTPRLTVPLLLITLGLPVACGDSTDDPAGGATPKSSSSSATLDAPFVQAADDVCAPYAEFTGGHLLQVEGFNRFVPDPKTLPQVADHLEGTTVYQDLVPDLEALGDPESGAAAWARLLDAFRATSSDVGLAAASARARDVDQFTDLVTTLQDDTSEVFSAITASGLGDTSCSKAMPDPFKAPGQQG